jgi:hypothetical protein
MAYGVYDGELPAATTTPVPVLGDTFSLTAADGVAHHYLDSTATSIRTG